MASGLDLLVDAQARRLHDLPHLVERSLSLRAPRSLDARRVGLDASNTQTVQAPIVGFALTNGGLTANLSIEGSTFSKIDF